VLDNPTISTLADPIQNSPALSLKYNRWSTNTAENKSGNWQVFAEGISTIDSASYSYLLFNHTKEGGVMTTPMRLTTAGALTILSALTVGSSGTFSGMVQISQAVTATSVTGLNLIENTSANATTAPNRYSPSFNQVARVWNSTSVASETVTFKTEVRPSSGANPTGTLYISADINGAGFADVLRLDSGGTLYPTRVSASYSLELNRP